MERVKTKIISGENKKLSVTVNANNLVSYMILIIFAVIFI